MNGFADIHHHLLYGMDDGARDADMMALMLRTAHDQGISAIIATPHVAPGIEPFDGAALSQRLREAQSYCDDNGLGIKLYPGAEILYTPLAAQFVQDGRVPPLAETRNVLVEFLPDVEYSVIEEAVSGFLRSGYRPILAHIERYRCLMRWGGRARRLKREYDVRYQVNCQTITAGQPFGIDRMIRSLLRDALIDFVASDAHNVTDRACLMRRAHLQLAQRVGAEYAALLVSGSGLLDQH